MQPAGVLIVVSALLVLALLVLTLVVIRLRGTTRELELALAEQSGTQDRATLLLKVAEAVNSSLAINEVLNVALTQAGRLIGAVAGAIYLNAPGKGEMRRQADYNLAHNARGAGRKLDEEPMRSMVAEARPLVVKLDETNSPGLVQGGRAKYVLMVPVQHSGQLMGAFELYLPEQREIKESSTDLLLGVAAQAAMAISHAQLYQAQEENALTDELTRLPNRRYMAQRFLQEMQRARRYHKGLAFVMIDLDHFKQVNDANGHLAGDEVLADLAKILVAGKRDSDVAARYGGEEFALILHETTAEGAMVLAERIRAAVEAATFPGDVKLTISLGVAATDDESRFTSLIERADEALYEAKAGGRNRVVLAEMKAVPAVTEDPETAPRPSL
jgi:diguanylate cyclase (GGDEF)-like protein